MNEHATSHELFSHALKTHIDAAREAAGRVIATGTARRAGAKAGSDGAKAGSDGAGGDAENEEAVHDLRVAIRRLRTTLKPAEKVYAKKKLKAVRQDLKRFADATSALRDEEVLRETLAELKLSTTTRSAVSAWVARRARQERARRMGVVRLLRESGGASSDGAGDAPTLEECLARLEKHLDEPKRDRDAAEFGLHTIKKARADLPPLGSADAADGAAMHALRIRFKRLRYTAELFKPVLGEKAARIAGEASRLQTCLGHLHDFDEATVRMARAWGLALRPRQAVLEALRAARAKMADRCKKELTAADIVLASTLDDAPSA